MRNKRNRRSRRLEIPSPEREIERTHVETPITGNESLTNFKTVIQKSLGETTQKPNWLNPFRLVTKSKFGPI